MKRRWLLLTLAALSLSVLVSAQFSGDFSDEFMENSAGRAFLQTFGALKSNYLNDVDDTVLIEGAIKGMLESLEDPYTNYATPDQASREVQDRTGSFEGIGAVLQARNRADNTVVEILNVYRGGPASLAGVQRGDVFATVDGTNVEDFTTDEIVDLVRGPAGTDVTIGFRRAGQEEPVLLTMTRGKIDIVSVESTVLPNNVGYVSINTFANQRVYDQLATQLEQLQAQGITSLILDLRNNGGGLLDQGIRVADEFLTQGDIVYQRARGVTQRLATADPAYFDLPMVVLVNGNSASASEIVAGALQDNGRAQVVGEETFGKGVGQSVVSLTDGGQLVYKSFEWLTPDRRSINEQGIEPDIQAEDTLSPNIITLEGQGAQPGQEVEISVGGQTIGTAQADEEGAFTFFQPVERPEASDVQGEALVNLETDNALQVAYNTVLNEATQPQNATSTQ